MIYQQPTTLTSTKLTLTRANAIIDAAHADTIGMQAITVSVVDESGYP